MRVHIIADFHKDAARYATEMGVGRDFIFVPADSPTSRLRGISNTMVMNIARHPLSEQVEYDIEMLRALGQIAYVDLRPVIHGVSA